MVPKTLEDAMADDLIFYTNPMSRGRIVRWMLEEVGAPYETVILEYASTLKEPAYLKINPMGKIPAIKHGDHVVTECAAICAYLADAFPEADLAPLVSSPDRAPYYRWLFFGAGPVEAALMNKACGFEADAQKTRMLGYGTLDLTLDTLERAVSAGDYLAGDTFSAADLYIAAQLGFGMSFGGIEKRPAFQAFVDRMTARPAHKRATEIDDALMPAQQPGG
jgi:glutathione S-transferase